MREGERRGVAMGRFSSEARVRGTAGSSNDNDLLGGALELASAFHAAAFAAGCSSILDRTGAAGSDDDETRSDVDAEPELEC